MTQPILQPFVYPFRGLLVDQYGQPTGVEFQARQYTWLMPSVVATRLKQGERSIKSKYLLACQSGTRVVESSQWPSYIGRGMIRLHAHKELRKDTLVNEQLEIINNPDRSFAGFSTADYIMDDESLALVCASEFYNSKDTIQGHFVVHSDGFRSPNAVSWYGFRGDILRDGSRPISIIGDSGNDRYYYPWLRGSPESLRGLSFIGLSELHSAFLSMSGQLRVFDHSMNQVAEFDGVENAHLTRNSRVVLHDNPNRYPSPPLNRRVFDLQGNCIRTVPDDSNWMLIERGRPAARRGFGNKSPISFHNGDFEPLFTLEPGHFNVQVSPDRRVFTASSPGSTGGKGSNRVFRCYSTMGELIQTFSVKHPSEYAQEAAFRDVTMRREERRRKLLEPTRTYVHVETFYAANEPEPKHGIIYLHRRSRHGYAQEPGVVYSLPRQGMTPCCPICGHACGEIRVLIDGTATTDVEWCKSCGNMLDDVVAHDYDDRLDREFGGQFGTFRRDWLDRTGWQDYDLDRLEYVFQVDTSTWPRELPDDR